MWMLNGFPANEYFKKRKKINNMQSTTANKWGVVLGIVAAVGGYLTSEAFLKSGHISDSAAFWITTVFGVIGAATIAYNGYQIGNKS